jgi:hypothetical protein
MANGIVMWFNDEKGYGFITPDEGSKACRVAFCWKRDTILSQACGPAHDSAGYPATADSYEIEPAEWAASESAKPARQHA